MHPAIELSQALLTPVTAVIATYIAYQQYRIRKDERLLALYDRRLAIFRLVIAIIDKVRAGKRLTTEDVLAWDTSMCEAEFIFGDEVITITQELFSDLYNYAGVSEALKADEYTTELAGLAIHIEYYRYPVMQVFTPYLHSVAAPRRKRRRLSKKAATKLIPSNRPLSDSPLPEDDDIPF